MASLVGAGERVDIPQLLQRWVKVPAKDAGRRQRLPVAGAEQEPILAFPSKLLQHGGDRWMKVDLARSARCLEPLFDFAMTHLLLNADGQEVRGDVLVRSLRQDQRGCGVP